MGWIRPRRGAAPPAPLQAGQPFLVPGHYRDGPALPGQGQR